MVEVEAMGRRVVGIHQVSRIAQQDGRRGDEFFADPVDRGVGDLGEELLEIQIKHLRFFAEHGQGGIDAHRPQRIQGVEDGGDHRRHDVFIGVSEGFLLLQEILADRGILYIDRGELREIDDVGLDPLGIGMKFGDFRLDLFIRNDPFGVRIDQKHLPGFKPPFAFDVFGIQVDDADFGRQDHPVVVGDDIARGTQSVAIQDGTDPDPVAERHRGRSVPRFHDEIIERVEIPFHLRKIIVLFVGFGDHHHDRMRKRSARQT